MDIILQLYVIYDFPSLHIILDGVLFVIMI